MKKEIYFYTKYDTIYSDITVAGVIKDNKIIERSNDKFSLYENAVLKLYNTDEIVIHSEKHYTYMFCSNLKKLQESLIQVYNENLIYNLKQFIKINKEKLVLEKFLKNSNLFLEKFILTSEIKDNNIRLQSYATKIISIAKNIYKISKPIAFDLFSKLEKDFKKELKLLNLYYNK